MVFSSKFPETVLFIHADFPLNLAAIRQELPEIQATLKSQGMNVLGLQTLFTGLIMSKITYALPSFAGQLTADDRNRIGAIAKGPATWCVMYGI